MKTTGRKQSGLLVLVLWLTGPMNVLAQSTAAAETPPSTPARPSGSAEQAPATHSVRRAMPSLLVTKIVTDKSEILSEQEIREVVSGYEQKQVTQTELVQIVDALNRLYAAKGFGTARAALAAQTVHDGVVHIRLIEGRVGKVTVQNKTHTRDSYFLNRVPISGGEILKPEELRQKLAYFNETNDLKMTAILQPGEQFGSTVVMLHADGPRDFEVTTFADNAGRDTIGLYRGGLNVTYRSLFGDRDPLTISFLGANGTLLVGGSYSLPLGTSGTRLGATFTQNAIALNGGVLGSTGMVGRSYDAALRLSRPLRVRSNTALSASLSAHYKTSSLSSEGFPLSRTQVRSLELSTEWQRFDAHGTWFASNAFNGGFDNLNGGFFRYNGLVTRILMFSPNVSAIFRASGQVNAVNTLAPIEQMQIGGASTVRGYPEAALIGDRGYAATGELDFPLLPNEWVKKRITLATFVDSGAVFDEGLNSSSKPHDTKLLSTGFGFVFRFSGNVSGRIDFGVPLQNRTGIPGVGIHFSVQSTFGFPHRWTTRNPSSRQSTGQNG